MVRGISDYADRNKACLEKESKDRWRAFAVSNAARFVDALLRRGTLKPTSQQYDLDLTRSTLLAFRRKRNPPIPSIEFRHEGAQDLGFSHLINRRDPNPKMYLKVRATLLSGSMASEYRGQCILLNFNNHAVPGELEMGIMKFHLPASEQGLSVELQLSFPQTVTEVQLECSDDFGRSCTKHWLNPVIS